MTQSAPSISAPEVHALSNQPDTLSPALCATLTNHTYVSLRTYRKSGEAIDTPLWVVSDGSRLYMITRAHAGKIKRIRNNGMVQVAPCTMRGVTTGRWINATAVVDDTDATKEKVVALLLAKYGWQFKITMWTMGKNWKQERTIVVVSGEE